MFELKKPIAFFVILTVAWLAMGRYLENVNTNQGNKIIPISIKSNVLHVEVVSSHEKLELGLGGRKDLCASCGMLFEFEKPGTYSFWMKDMLIPLDMLWISEGKIMHIEKNIQPDFKGTLTPSESADKVLEINAGKSDELGIKVGDSVSF